ncbi:response regulator [candidate division KSB1 bacterium]
MKRNSFSTIEIAHLLGISRLTVNNWIRNKKLNSYTTPGGHYRILKTDLDNFLKENNCPPVEFSEISFSKALIVDDEKSILKTLSDMVRMKYDGVSVETADNGFDAGKLVLTYKPDLVILDIGMVNMDGFDVCGKIKQDPDTGNIKVVMITGMQGEDLMDKAYACGADGFLNKPISISELENEIDRLFQIEKKPAG